MNECPQDKSETPDIGAWVGEDEKRLLLLNRIVMSCHFAVVALRRLAARMGCADELSYRATA